MQGMRGKLLRLGKSEFDGSRLCAIKSLFCAKRGAVVCESSVKVVTSRNGSVSGQQTDKKIKVATLL